MRFNHEIIIGQPRKNHKDRLCSPGCLEHTFGLTRERKEELITALEAHADDCRDLQAGTADLHRFVAGPETLTLTTPTEVFAAGYVVAQIVRALQEWVETRAGKGTPAIEGISHLPKEVQEAMHKMMAANPGAEGEFLGVTVVEVGPNGTRVVGSTVAPATPEPTHVPEGAQVVSSGNIFSGKTAKE